MNTTIDLKPETGIIRTVRRWKSQKTEPEQEITKINNSNNATDSDLPRVPINKQKQKSSKNKSSLNNREQHVKSDEIMHNNNQNQNPNTSTSLQKNSKKKVNTSESNTRISIDGGHSKQSYNKQNSHMFTHQYSLNSRSEIKFDYRKLKKPKTDYQKNILSLNNINKYKEDCLSVLKGDKELMNLFIQAMKITTINDNIWNDYITQTYINNDSFWIKLEMIILQDIEDTTTLKVFSANKGKSIPIKIQKVNYYRNAIKNDLLKKIYDWEYQIKAASLWSNWDTHISMIENYQL